MKAATTKYCSILLLILLYLPCPASSKRPIPEYWEMQKIRSASSPGQRERLYYVRLNSEESPETTLARIEQAVNSVFDTIRRPWSRSIRSNPVHVRCTVTGRRLVLFSRDYGVHVHLDTSTNLLGFSVTFKESSADPDRVSGIQSRRLLAGIRPCYPYGEFVGVQRLRQRISLRGTARSTRPTEAFWRWFMDHQQFLLDTTVSPEFKCKSVDRELVRACWLLTLSRIGPPDRAGVWTLTVFEPVDSSGRLFEVAPQMRNWRIERRDLREVLPTILPDSSAQAR